MASPELEQLYKKYRNVKRKAAQTRIGQAVGGGAETMRTGRSAAETFAARAPQYDTMSAKEKMAAKAAINKEIASQEQWAFEKALQERLDILKENNALTKAALVYIQSMRASDVSAAGHAANLKVRELEFRQAALNKEFRELVAPSKGTAAAWKRTRAGLGASFEDLRADPQFDAYSDEDLLAYSQSVEASTDGLANALAAEAKNLEPGQIRHFFKMAAQEMGISETDLLNSLDDTTAGLLEQEMLASEKRAQAIEVEYADNNVKLATAPSWAYGKRPDPAILEQAQARAQQGPVMEGAPAPEGAPAGPGGDLEQDPSKWSGMYGVQGIKPAGTAYDRTIQTLDMIDQYPEHPPLQEARQQIMQGQEFKDYMARRGYQDEDFAFKEMNREMRLKKRSKLKASKTSKKLGIADGSVPTRGSEQPAPTEERVRRERAKQAASVVSGSE